MSSELVESKLNELMSLAPADRLELAERLIEATPAVGDPEIERAWAEEIGRRVKEYEQGREP